MSGPPTDGTTTRPNEWLDGVVLRAKDAGDGWMHVPVSDWHGVIDGFRMGEGLYAEAEAQRDEALHALRELVDAAMAYAFGLRPLGAAQRLHTAIDAARAVLGSLTEGEQR